MHVNQHSTKAAIYLCGRLKHYSNFRTLRSASETLSLQIPRTRLSTLGPGVFFVFGPSAWNDFLFPLRQKLSLDSLRSDLKIDPFPNQQTCHVLHTALLSSSASCLCVCRRARVCVCFSITADASETRARYFPLLFHKCALITVL